MKIILLAAWTAINSVLISIIFKKIKTIMATEQQFKDALVRIDAATTKGGVAATAIAARVTALEDAIKNAGLSPEVEAALLAQTEGVAGSAESLATALEAMGKTPTDPVPTEPPAPIEEIP